MQATVDAPRCPREGTLRASNLAGRRIRHQAGRRRVVRGRARPARRDRRPAGRRRERARADARAPGAADQRLDRDGRRRHHARAGGADRPRHWLRRLAGLSLPGAACATTCSMASSTSRCASRSIPEGEARERARVPAARGRAHRQQRRSTSRPTGSTTRRRLQRAGGHRGAHRRAAARGRPGGNHLRARPAQPGRRRARAESTTSATACCGAPRRCASGWTSLGMQGLGRAASIPALYNRNATLAENLLFGTPVGTRVRHGEPRRQRLRAPRAARDRAARAPGAHRPQGRRDHGRAVQRPAAGPRVLRPVQLHQPGRPAAVRGDPGARGRRRAEGAGGDGTAPAARAAVQADRRPAPPGTDRRGLRGARDRGAALLRRQAADGARAARSNFSIRRATTARRPCRTTSSSARSSPGRPARSSASPRWCARCSTSSACGPRW